MSSAIRQVQTLKEYFQTSSNSLLRTNICKNLPSNKTSIAYKDIKGLLNDLSTPSHKKLFQQRMPLVGYQFDNNGSFMLGPREAPPLIRQAFLCPAGEYYEYTPDQKCISIENLLVDCGDLHEESCTHKNISTVSQNIMKVNLEANENNVKKMKPVISLGGDHSITYPIIEGFKQVKQLQDEKIALIHFDAHPDMYPGFMDNDHSHASPFYNLLENKLIDRIIQIGLRDLTPEQQETKKKYHKQLSVVEMPQLYVNNPMQVITKQLELFLQKCKEDKISHFYLSIDIDVLDPSYAPGVSHYEPGGLTVRELFASLDMLFYEKKLAHEAVIGCDIVEYNPRNDLNYMTAFVSARLLRRVAALIETRGKN